MIQFDWYHFSNGLVQPQTTSTLARITVYVVFFSLFLRNFGTSSISTPPKNGGFSSIFFRSVKPPQFGVTWMCGSVDVDSDAWTQGSMLVFGGVLGGGFTWICFMSPVKDYSRFLPIMWCFIPETICKFAPGNRPKPKKEMSSSNHSKGQLLVSGGVITFGCSKEDII